MIRVDENVGIAQLDGCLGEMDYLDFSFRKSVKRVGRKVKKVVKKAGRSLKKVVRQPQRLLYALPVLGQIGYVLKRNKKLRARVFKTFVQAAPFISAAAMLLNLVVPGLGIVVGLAISAASLAIQLSAARQAKKAMKKAEAEIARDEAEAEKDADEKTMAAYDKAPQFFADEYGVTREEFQAATIEERYKFLNLTIYDIFQPEMTAEGISRDQFQEMSLEDQQDLIAKVGQAAKEVEGAKAKGVSVPQAPEHTKPVPATPVPLFAAPALAADGTNWTPILIVGGVALAGVLLLVYLKGRS